MLDHTILHSDIHRDFNPKKHRTHPTYKLTPPNSKMGVMGKVCEIPHLDGVPDSYRS
jgi:hypothetical protein